MSSIGGSVNPLGSTFLTQFSGENARRIQLDRGAFSTGAATSDRVDLSASTSAFTRLQQLQSTNPTAVSQALTEAAAKLQAAASVQSDAQVASLLSHLAAEFQTAAATGDLAVLKPVPSISGPRSVYAFLLSHRHREAPVEDQAPAGSEPQPGKEVPRLLGAIIGDLLSEQRGK